MVELSVKVYYGWYSVMRLWWPWKAAAMFNRCPGAERTARIQLFNCPKCGAEVEIFSNEVKVNCGDCGDMVYSERLPSCIDWCASARECLGEERWQQLKGQDEGQ